MAAQWKQESNPCLEGDMQRCAYRGLPPGLEKTNPARSPLCNGTLPSDFLGDPQYFVGSGYSGQHFTPSIFLERPHSRTNGLRLKDRRIRCRHNRSAHFIIDIQQLENSNPAFIPRMVAVFATLPLLQFDPLARFVNIKSKFSKRGRRNSLGPLTLLAVHTNETLGKNTDERRRQQIVFDTHVDQSRHCAGSIVGMKSTENKMAGEGRTDSDVGRLKVANLSNHNDIRVLPHDMPKTSRKCQSDLGIDVDLVDPFHLIFDRIFDRDDLTIRNIDPL